MAKGGDSVKRLFRKLRKEKRIVPPMPEWNEIVEMLYDKNLDFFVLSVFIIYKCTLTKLFFVVTYLNKFI